MTPARRPRADGRGRVRPVAVDHGSTPELAPSLARRTRWASYSLALITALASAATLAAQPAALACPDPVAIAGDELQPRAAVRYLADPALEGRLTGTPGEACTAEYVAREFERLGVVPAYNGSYFQEVFGTTALDPHGPAVSGRNVAGVLLGDDPVRRNDVVIIGAHHDHLGTGSYGSMAPAGSGGVHHGADDNASGVAALLRIAEALATGPRPAGSVMFVTFTGEELGLLGSSRFVNEPPLPLERVRAMVNLDMVGRLGAGPLIVYGTGTAAEWESILADAVGPGGPELATDPSGYGPSDHTSFYARDIPVLHFFTNVHEDYHRPSDTWDRVDYEGLETVADIVERVVRLVADRHAPLTLQRGAGQPITGGTTFDAYLGSIPDFTPVAKGVLLSGVGGGSPAEVAGIRGGDIIIRFGDFEVADLQGLSDALAAHRPGDTVTVVVLRNGEEISFTVTLGRR